MTSAVGRGSGSGRSGDHAVVVGGVPPQRVEVCAHSPSRQVVLGILQKQRDRPSQPIDKKTDYDDWTRLLQKAGVRHVRLHDGRHTAATLLLTENVHPRVVMELLGHSQMRTTMDIYSHVMPALAREAVDRMGALLLAGKGRQTATTETVDSRS